MLTKEKRAALKPRDIIRIMREGNQSFADGTTVQRDFHQEQLKTAVGQYPAAIVLSCMDSRAPAEIIFNLGLGDIFNARVAGNILDADIAGSMEYACKVAKSKLILVMGHTNCGAVEGAIDRMELGNLTGLLSKIKPAIDAVIDVQGVRNSNNKTFVDAVARMNVSLTIENIRRTSPVLKTLEDDGDIEITGAMYDVESGKVEFYDKL